MSPGLLRDGQRLLRHHSDAGGIGPEALVAAGREEGAALASTRL